ncbi:cytochrome P450 [Solirhodobacter olei]|uniref:cytochrome P450 n=1 Tax=Solirhodobacter olei TaxID=2493082 RepID=UPI0013E336A3|nr:cytochrome P450 [Solirhodobacter olei]
MSRRRAPPPHRYPPRPRGGLPFLGHMPAFAGDQLGYPIAVTRDYGDMVEMNLAGYRTWLVSDTAAVEQVLVSDHQKFIKTPLIWRQLTAVFGTGVLACEGSLWQHQRRIAAPPFTPRRVQAYDGRIVSLAKKEVDRWKGDATFDVHPPMMNLMLRTLTGTVFDADTESEVKIMEHALRRLLHEMSYRFRRPVLIPDWLPLPSNRRYLRAIADIDGVVGRIVAERKRVGTEGRNDYLSTLLTAKDQQGRPLTPKQIRDDMFSVLIAGHETTALTLTFTFYLLTQHPEIQARVIAEIDEVLGERDATSEDIARLKLTNAVILESMRVYPAAWMFGREAIEDCEIQGYHCPKGTQILIAPWVIHRDARHYEDPETFRPDRWLDGLAQRIPRCAFLPFGGGPRICVGNSLSMIETTLSLATILQRGSVEWRGTAPIKLYPSATIIPQGGVPIAFKPRVQGAAPDLRQEPAVPVGE